MSAARVVVRRIDAVLASAPPPGDWLSPSEQTRAAAMRAPARHAQYLAGHWLLRTLLASAHGGDPRDYALQERENQPPAVAGAALRTALSHGGDYIAAAVSAAAIGIDLEPRTPRPALRRLQHLLLNPDEPPDSLDDDALLQRWVIKEALIKRDHGSALPESLAAIRIHPAQDATAADVRVWTTAGFHLAVAPAGVADVDLGRFESETQTVQRRDAEDAEERREEPARLYSARSASPG